MTHMHKFLGIIPARFASTRFPGKPLVDIRGKKMIQLVYEQATKALDSVVVATDNKQIFDEVKLFGGHVVMTSEMHPSGTDRCKEALEIFKLETHEDYDVVINIQGDEPFIKPGQIKQLMECFEDKSVDIATLVKEITSNHLVFDPNKPKVVVNNNMEALYFSRSAIPYCRGKEPAEWYKMHNFYQHIGMYAYRVQALNEITDLLPSKLEQAESLEQLRWLEHGYKIKTALTTFETIGIDTPEDLEEAIKYLED